jgi:predicted dehydrogenase
MPSRRTFLQTCAGAAAWTARSYSAIPGANERLRVGVIGCGGMATSHMRALLKMKDTDNVEITAVCDVYQKRLDRAASLTGGRPFQRYPELLSARLADYVLIATPEHWHHRMTLDALAAGLHIYVEKPLTHSLAEAREVARKVQAHGGKIKVQVGVQGMSDESYAEANRLIREGRLGKVVMAQIDYSRNYNRDFWTGEMDPDVQPGVNLDWKAWLGPAPKRPFDPDRFFHWRRYWDYSGGIATDLFIHRVTRIIRAVGLTFPETVSAAGGKWNWVGSPAEIPDTFNMLCDYPGGPTVVLVSSLANDTPIDHVIRGKNATLRFTREGFDIIPQRAATSAVVPVPGSQALGQTGAYIKKGAEDVTLHHRNLMAAIRENAPLHCDVQLGYYGGVAALMGVEAFRKHAVLKWNRQKERAEKA